MGEVRGISTVAGLGSNARFISFGFFFRVGRLSRKKCIPSDEMGEP